MNKFGPKQASHPSIDLDCPACDEPFKEGDYTTLVPVGPGSDPENRKLARLGRAYTAIACEVHWACATGKE